MSHPAPPFTTIVSRSLVRTLRLMALTVVLVLSVVVAARPSDAQPAACPEARLAPCGGVLFGVNLDWGTDSAAAFDARLGHNAAVYVQFVQVPLREADVANLEGFVDQVAAQRGIALLTLEPFDGLEAVTPAVIDDLADRLAQVNERGVPVLVRFAHEMNGSWYPWSQQPAAYIAAYRALALVLHERVPQTAMLWAPNYGSGYPYRGGQYEARAGTADMQALDTNHDGMLDQRDDMYAPYYPGDDVVDWVGMSLYHWGDRYPWGKNIFPEPGKFIAQLTGTYVGANGDERDLPDFYADYAVARGKPLAIAETAAFYNTTVGGDDELSIKQAWWRQVFDPATLRAYPRIAMLNWFEWRKFETEVDAIVDWTVTRNPDIIGAFRADLPLDLLRFGNLDR